MNRTKIPWVKNTDNVTLGYTINPQTGCLNCIGGLCGGFFPCYAYLESVGRCHLRDLEGIPITPGHSQESFYPRIHAKRLSDLQHAPRGAGIFVDDRSDWCASYWPEEIPRRILSIATRRLDIRLYLLTKQPQNLPRFSPFPPNCWPGVSAIDVGMFAAAYFWLAKVQATVKFISLEPFLTWDLRVSVPMLYQAKQAGVSWLIIGSQTKPTIHPAQCVVESVIDAADKAGVSVFVKEPLASHYGIGIQIMPKVQP